MKPSTPSLTGTCSTASMTKCCAESPPANQNSVAWLVWHATRWEDVIINTWITDRGQVLDVGGWSDRLGLDTRHVGTAMTPEEVFAITTKVDLTALRDYRTATAAATVAAVKGMTDSDLERPVGVGRLEQGAPDGAYHNSRAPWMDEFWAGHDVAWFLSFLNVHSTEHTIGEALAVRGQMGVPLGLGSTDGVGADATQRASPPAGRGARSVRQSPSAGQDPNPQSALGRNRACAHGSGVLRRAVTSFLAWRGPGLSNHYCCESSRVGRTLAQRVACKGHVPAS
jgi:hypothetical protein